MEQPRLGDLRAEQHEDAVAVLGLLDVLWSDLRRGYGVAEDTVQSRPHPGARKIGTLKAAESLDVEGEDAPVFRFCAHRPTRLV